MTAGVVHIGTQPAAERTRLQWCDLCDDGAYVLDDDNEPTHEYCDCDRGRAQAEADDAEWWAS